MIDFRDFIIWEGMMHFGFLALLLMFANVLRRKVPFLRRSLLPTAVIAGFVGLLVKELVYARIVDADQVQDTNVFLGMITYHAIALGFIALGLKVHEKFVAGTRKGQSFFNGMIIVSTYLLQGLIGLALTLFFAYTFFPSLFASAGLLLPMGFGQGPGQALNIGGVYEHAHGFQGGASFGLSIASFGFIWASLVGVVYLNVQRKRGRITRKPSQKAGLVSSQEIETPDEIPVAEAIDKFTVQIALVLLVYFFTYVFMYSTSRFLETGVLGDFGLDTIRPLIWGFNFIFGMLFALVAKQLFLFLRRMNIMTRQYPNNYMLNRIAGLVFDFMIVAAISAIRIEDLSGLWIPFFILVIAAGIATIVYVNFICKRVYPGYPMAATMGMFGMLTGTASTGVILLREVDSEFRTPAATDLVTGSSTAIMFGFPVLLLVGVAPISPLMTFLTLGIIIVLYALFVSLLLKFNPRRSATGK